MNLSRHADVFIDVHIKIHCGAFEQKFFIRFRHQVMCAFHKNSDAGLLQHALCHRHPRLGG